MTCLSVIDQPAGTNFSNKILANIGNMENRGVEFTINTQPVRNKDLTWDFGFNITYNKNEITKLTFTNDPNFPGNLVGGIAGGVGSTIQIHSVGFPKSSFYVYQQVYDKDGKPIENLFEDRNRDGQININDLYRYKSPDPDVFLGAYSNVSWKKWNAGFALRANFGNYMYNNRFSNTGVQRNIIDPLGYLANGSTKCAWKQILQAMAINIFYLTIILKMLLSSEWIISILVIMPGICKKKYQFKNWSQRAKCIYHYKLQRVGS